MTKKPARDWRSDHLFVRAVWLAYGRVLSRVTNWGRTRGALEAFIVSTLGLIEECQQVAPLSEAEFDALRRLVVRLPDPQRGLLTDDLRNDGPDPDAWLTRLSNGEQTGEPDADSEVWRKIVEPFLVLVQTGDIVKAAPNTRTRWPGPVSLARSRLRDLRKALARLDAEWVSFREGIGWKDRYLPGDKRTRIARHARAALAWELTKPSQLGPDERPFTQTEVALLFEELGVDDFADSDAVHKLLQETRKSR